VNLARIALAGSILAVAGCSSAETDAPDHESTDSALGALPHTPVYSATLTQSPITPAIASRLASIPRGQSRADVFAKVGDSQTVNAGFMHCFAHDDRVDLATHAGLEPARRTFLGAFDRESLSAKIGASASFALGGPLGAELDATLPHYAVVMYGSNDIQNAPTGGISTYARDMMKITDTLLQRGVIPLLTAPPPRPLRASDVAAFGPEGADVWAPRYASVVRGIAQARQVPFIDLARELRKIPKFGIGADNLHLIAAPAGPCHLDEASLKYGVNVRNLVTLEALKRAHDAVESGVAPDATASELAGNGRSGTPFVVPELPFSDLRSASQSSDQGQACGARALFTYRVKIERPAQIHVGLFARGDKAFVRDGHGNCKSVSGGDAVMAFDAGESDVVVTASAAPAGEHLLTLTPD
jgi:hypothetical protein